MRGPLTLMLSKNAPAAEYARIQTAIDKGGADLGKRWHKQDFRMDAG